MKNAKFITIAVFAAIIAIAACTKDKTVVLPGQIAATKIKVKINEPDTLLLVGADSTKTVNWTVTPAGFDTLLTQKNAARLKFTKAGNYTVNATETGQSPASIVITVSDSVYTPPENPLFTPLTGDQITLTPGIYTSPAGDTTAIAFTVATHNAYCTNSELSYGYGGHANMYSFNAVGVSHILPCGIGTSTLTGSFNYGLFDPVLTEGTFPLTGLLNGVTYNGTITVTATTITFTWPYTSGILITPKVVNR